MRLLAAATAVLLLAGCQSAPADPAAASDALLARYLDEGEPGCSAAVGRAGDVVWAGALGIASIDSGESLTTESVFDLASVSKQFTAVAILLLEAEGALSLDEPLSLYLPELGVHADQVTIEALLHHTTGIPDYTALLDAELNEPTTQQDAIDALTPLAELSGSDGFSYSNSNYVLLAEVAEAASGVPLAELLQTRVFEPLQLDMRLEPLYDGPKVATGHEAGSSVHAAWMQIGDGSVYATPSELVRWADSYRSGEVGGEQLLAAQIADAVDTGRSAYGAGIEIAPDGSLSHLGGWAGVVTLFGITADRHTSIAVSCNSVEANGAGIAEELRSIWT